MKIIGKYLVLTLALLITLSAAGINISLHRCCGSIKHFSLISSAKECKMAQKKAVKKCSSSSAIHKKDLCCADQQISLNSTDKATNERTTIHKPVEKPGFDVLFFYTLIKNWVSETSKVEPAEKPSPGLFFLDALILLLQQFRI